MDNQIEVYHNLTAFYLGPEQEMRAEIEELQKKLADTEEKLRKTKDESSYRANREWWRGQENGNKKGFLEGSKEGYDKGYQESIEAAELIYALGLPQKELEALDSLGLTDKLRSKILDIYFRALQRGWLEARKIYAVTYHCCECRKIMEVETEKERGAAREYMEKHRWGHAACFKD